MSLKLKQVHLGRILQLAYKIGFLEDDETWLLMLKQRNLSVHIYNENEINVLLDLIWDKFIPAFLTLEQTLQEKMTGIQDDDDRSLSRAEILPRTGLLFRKNCTGHYNSCYGEIQF